MIHWLFDCDNTLYRAGTGFFDRVNGRITEYMETVMGMEPAFIAPLRKRYRAEYGVTLAGLMAEYGVDPGHYLPFVHDVPLNDLIEPDPALLDSLAALPGRRVVFTNGSMAHACRVLERLGVAPAFEAVYEIEFMDYVPKPKPHGYLKILDHLGIDANQSVMVDDHDANLETAQKIGMITVKVGGPPPIAGLHAETASGVVAAVEAAGLIRRG